MIRRHPIARSQKPIQRRAPVRKRRVKPRRGRVSDRAFVSWVHENFGCLVAFAGGCGGPLTWHHVRDHGSQKDDTWGLLLCFAHHEVQGGSESIEALGKEKWERRFGMLLAVEPEKYRQAYLDAGHRFKEQA